MDRGSLAQAMRATMSLPLIFPPVERDGRILVDGGTMNNVPADVVRAMGADRVIAVNVGDLNDREGINYSMPGLAGATLDAMMRVDDEVVDRLGRRHPERAAGRLRIARLATQRRPDPGRLRRGRGDARPPAAVGGDRGRVRAVAAGPAEPPHPDRARSRRSSGSKASAPTTPVGSRRCSSVTSGCRWICRRSKRTSPSSAGSIATRRSPGGRRKNEAGETGLVVTGRAKSYAPPFMMLGAQPREHHVGQLPHLRHGALPGVRRPRPRAPSCRIDGTLGSDPAIWSEFYQPIGSSALFVAPYAGVFTSTFNVIDDDELVAQYDQVFSRVGANLGVNLGARSDLRVGAFIGRLNADVAIGDPGFPSVSGAEKAAEAVWRYDGQDSPIVPSGGSLATIRLSHVFDAPDVTVEDQRYVDVVADAAVGDGQPVLERRRAVSRVRLRGPRHVVRRPAAAAEPVRARVLRASRRLPPGRAARQPLLRWQCGGTCANWAACRTSSAGRSSPAPGSRTATRSTPGVTRTGAPTSASASSWTPCWGRWWWPGSAGFDGRWRTYVGVGRIFR